MSAPLLNVTIHDVAPRWLSEVRTLRAQLVSWGVARLTLLAVPHFHHGVRLVDDAATRTWLVDCAERGDEIALHGYHHVQAGEPRALVARLRARMWTAGEGECLRPAAPIAELLHRGRDELARILPAAPAGFVAPAWLEPPGFARTLARLGFAWHETSRFVEQLGAEPDRTAWRGDHRADHRIDHCIDHRAARRLHAPALGFATRTPRREAMSLAWARAVSLVSLRWPCLPALRLAVHPADLRSSRVMTSLEAIARRAARTHRAVTTSELLRA